MKRSKGLYHHSGRRLVASDSQVSCQVAVLEYFQTSVHQETQHTDLEYIQESQTLTKFQIVAFPYSWVYHEIFILRY